MSPAMDWWTWKNWSNFSKLLWVTRRSLRANDRFVFYRWPLLVIPKWQRMNRWNLSPLLYSNCSTWVKQAKSTRSNSFRGTGVFLFLSEWRILLLFRCKKEPSLKKLFGGKHWAQLERYPFWNADSTSSFSIEKKQQAKDYLQTTENNS